MELHEIYLELPAAQIAYVKFIFESYEEVGIVRTVDNRKAVIVLLVLPAFLDVAKGILSSLKEEILLREISRPATAQDDWFMAELLAGRLYQAGRVAEVMATTSPYKIPLVGPVVEQYRATLTPVDDEDLAAARKAPTRELVRLLTL